MRQHVQELKNGRRPHKDVSSSRILGLVLTWLLKTAPIKKFLNADISKWIEVNIVKSYIFHQTGIWRKTLLWPLLLLRDELHSSDK